MDRAALSGQYRHHGAKALPDTGFASNHVCDHSARTACLEGLHHLQQDVAGNPCVVHDFRSSLAFR